jgi:MFS family permease
MEPSSSNRTALRNITLLQVFQFLKSLQFFGAIAVPFYLEWGGLDYTRMFILEGAFSLFMFVLEVPTGTIADRFGRKWSMILGALCSGIALMIFGLVRSYPLFFVANFLCALGMTCISGADQALLYDTLLSEGRSDEGRRILSRFQAIGTVGLLVGFPAGSLIAGSSLVPRPQSLALTFVLSGIVFALSAIPLLLLIEPARAEKVHRPFHEGIEGIRALLRPGDLRRFTLNYALISATGFFMFWFYQSLAREAAVQVAWNGVFGAGINVAGMILLWNASRLEVRLGLPRLLLTTALVPGLLYLGLGIFRAPLFAFPAAFLIAGMKMLRAPLLSDLINRVVESRNRATMLSGVSMLERAVVFILYPLVGAAADRSLSTAFFGLGAATLLFAMLSHLPSAARAGNGVPAGRS